MITRGLVVGLLFGLGLSGAAMATEDQALRDYDRESLDFLFEQTQSAGPISGMSEDDLLITGSIGSTSDKKVQPAAESDQPLPLSRPAD